MYDDSPEYITIPDHPPVSEEMKEINIEGQPYQGLVGELSEWAARMAIRDFPVALSSFSLKSPKGLALFRLISPYPNWWTRA